MVLKGLTRGLNHPGLSAKAASPEVRRLDVNEAHLLISKCQSKKQASHRGPCWPAVTIFTLYVCFALGRSTISFPFPCGHHLCTLLLLSSKVQASPKWEIVHASGTLFFVVDHLTLEDGVEGRQRPVGALVMLGPIGL